MSYELSIGFCTKPAGLEQALEQLGFTRKRHTAEQAKAFWEFLEGLGKDPFGEADFSTKRFEYFDPQSAAAVECCYYDRLFGDGLWRDRSSSVVACVLFCTNGASTEYDRAKQWEAARRLRDAYGALLYDPQQNKLIVD